MNFRILPKVFYAAIFICLSSGHIGWCYTAQDAAALRLQTPVVNGAMPPDIAAIQQRGVLRMAINKNPAPPFSIVDSKGNWSGLEIDFGNRVAQNLGVKLTLVFADNYDDLTTLLVAGKADMAMGLSILPSREQQVSFSNPYYSYHPHLLVNRLAASQYGWTTPDKLMNGLKTTKETIIVGVFSGNIIGQILEQTFPNTRVTAYTDRTQCFQDVVDGKIFACMGATPIEIRGFLQDNSQATLHANDIEISTMEDLLGVAIPWQNFHLREWLNIYISYLEQNGIREQLSKQYGYPI